MSELRERVARAIVGYRCGCSNNGCPWFPDRMVGTNGMCDCTPPSVVADAAMEAMQAEPTDPSVYWSNGKPVPAEPTEAEIEAARHEYITKLDAYIEAAKANADCQCYSRDDYPECVETIYENAGHEAMRAALLAARTARQGGQR